MSVGLLIIGHNGIGAAMLGTATLMLKDCPLKAKLLTASIDSEPDELTANATEQVKLLDEGDGILILTDLYGATPFNIAQCLAEEGDVRIVTGLNLSMLIRVLNYPQLGLNELAEKAISGGKDGIVTVNGK